MREGRLVSVQVGLPRHHPDGGGWYSGILKEPVSGPVRLSTLGLDGDEQADTKNHGGPERAALAYCAEHYVAWHDEIEGAKLPFGSLGENLTISGLDEDTVCIGDLYQLGDVRLRVSQPRQPCWKLERRLGRPGIVEQVTATGRTGWYFAVEREGVVEAGQPVRLLERPFPEWTVTRAQAVMRGRAADPGAAARLAGCPYLSASWRAALTARS